ncbi:NADH dehydrogenase [ubiquinone] 1 beta subcomplex subunit 2-like isoform X4 [Malania oleifera]|uniref:NADH dehydrogenase [ubiquinone] 1 beta subcomplex subunit 2-like isoform X4 n=1 Tax=Malania oleifera TaxID=397392 RepID=UPI0025ADB539|nr:NADH dehydrogenase [ubiquinone] 1 beta subcomplex subunit 2-like isoform X4 [Malania oleifera]XP_057972984.1 NADH dehydrogenase [ubiquinone] 1 beta subcomplex subunit 2-like isoform X4 [Malania oleifera]XP_057972986.1 NADH dehydrogenase [ubiquinone] 1 beta subcomplex subunit 2-like isoform X4 [Malania oleifera]XP_057972989.1 NADH dehydrogenase [ubiquinone] 1 beta subcomplex subunit 2-like isoform X4 [Malania oleifera]
MGGEGHGRSTTYKGVTLHHPKRWHAVTGKGLCAIMWFWVLYRAKQDGPVVLGWRHPWEGHEDHSHEHGHEHENEIV